MPPEQPPLAPTGPASFLAAAAALRAIDQAMRGAHTQQTADPLRSETEPEQALASLLLLREVREELATWETGLVEAARRAGASWADLAAPLGVASRQAAERRYLRQRPGAAGTTGEQRVQATRNDRAADRTVTTWARHHTAELRGLAGQILALPNLPAAARTPLGHLNDALAGNDPATLIEPLIATQPHLQEGHPDLATRINTISRHTAQLRQASHDKRRA
ncbi:hypothetical protein [Streptomyces lydicamycinicus]|uniref:Putative transcriptional regulator n=1 Tax=Streptomyces lydicamycinicus TaxID=1546107 RepID=A0A0P4R431_9ACTN|nr:hypothetical protein [Streptomyces lydicamycinicus]GAO07653.1 putative transcriptional regulator [Streptomyces lydicamycinicus]